MSSRDKILNAIRQNKPDLQPLPAQFTFESNYSNVTEKFFETLKGISGNPLFINDLSDIRAFLNEHYHDVQNIATTIPDLSDVADFSLNVSDPHDLEMINLAIIEGEFAVAENGAIWVSERHVPHRVLPFITQYLAIVIHEKDIVENMHRAYERVNITDTGWGCFVAGPSKTADIEQSLVIGAHGARGLTVFVLRK
jgi:L-lactate dehydrogenase complex protein LldG